MQTCRACGEEEGGVELNLLAVLAGPNMASI